MLTTGEIQMMDVQTRVISQRMQTVTQMNHVMMSIMINFLRKHLMQHGNGFTAKETRFASMKILAVISILTSNASTMSLDNNFLPEDKQ